MVKIASVCFDDKFFPLGKPLKVSENTDGNIGGATLDIKKRILIYGTRSLVSKRNANRRVILLGSAKGNVEPEDVAITEVSDTDWEEIKQLYGTLPIFKNGLLKKVKNMNEAKSFAKDYSQKRLKCRKLPATNGLEEVKSREEADNVGNSQSIPY